jgi:Cu/Ag efflux protein CusF
MKIAIKNSVLVILLASSGIVLAGEPMQGMSQANMNNMKPSASTLQGHKAEGVVNRIDMQKGTVNLTHGPVKSLGWQGMTMDFKVTDAAILSGIKPGQKVAFEIVKEGPGKFFVNKIAPLK